MAFAWWSLLKFAEDVEHTADQEGTHAKAVQIVQIKHSCVGAGGFFHLLYPPHFLWPHVQASTTPALQTTVQNMAVHLCTGHELRNVVVGIIVENTLAAAQARLD